MTLDYRFPDTGAHRVQQVMRELNTEAAVDWVIAFAKLLFGIPLCLLAPLFLAFFITDFPRRTLLSHPERMIPRTIALSLVIVPCLFYIAYRKRRDFLWEALQEKFEPWTPVLELLLLGPKLILSLIEEFRMESRPEQEIVALAAMIVIELLDHDQSVPVQQFLAPQRVMEEVSQALRLLERRGWICVSRQRGRVWLASSVRRQFASLR